MDCFVASLLAMTWIGATQPKTVIPRESGGSSTPRPIDSITDVSGILDHPHARVMTTEALACSFFKKQTFAFPRRGAPELLQEMFAPKREGAGNAGRSMHPQPRM